MKKILYIISKPPGQDNVSLLSTVSSSQENTSVVLIHDAVKHREVPFSRVFTLSDNVSSERPVSTFPSVSYQDLLRMIFEADTVAVL